MKLRKWIDGYGHYSHIPNNMKKYFNISNNGKYIPCCVGIVLTHKYLNVFLPHNMIHYAITSRTINLLIYFIHQDLEYGAKSTFYNKRYEESDLYKNVQWLVNDFRLNGVFKKPYILDDYDQGNIDWTQTVESELPLIDQNGIYYQEPIRHYNDHKFTWLSRLHGTVIQNIAKHYGSLFNGFSYIYPYQAINIKRNQLRICLRLHSLLRSLYTNRDKQLVFHLLTLLKFNGHSEGQMSIATKSFWYVFETEFKRYVHHKESLKQYISQPKWSFHLPWHQEPIKTNNTQIPDALVRRPHSNIIDIYDAKYYDLLHYKNKLYCNEPMLQTYSVDKQYLYQLEFQAHQYKIGQNSFVFPMHDSRPFRFRKYGHVTCKIGNQLMSLNVLFIDPMKLLSHNYHNL